MSEALVLLHGFTGAPSSFDALLERLPPDRAVFRPALAGHRGAPPKSASWDAEVDRLAGEIRAHVGEGVHLFGYSLGARIALSLLASHPGLASRATLNGARLPPLAPSEREARARRDEALARRLETEPIERFVRDWEALPLFESQRELPEALRAKRRAERMSHDALGLAASLRTLGLAAMPDLRPALSRVLTPVTLVVGERDAGFLAHADELLGHLPRARLVVVECAGHDLSLERPAELAAILAEDER